MKQQDCGLYVLHMCQLTSVRLPLGLLQQGTAQADSLQWKPKLRVWRAVPGTKTNPSGDPRFVAASQEDQWTPFQERKKHLQFFSINHCRGKSYETCLEHQKENQKRYTEIYFLLKKKKHQNRINKINIFHKELIFFLGFLPSFFALIKKK